MRIENKTDWRTDHIKSFVRRIAQDELSPRFRLKDYRIFVEYRRQGSGVSGRGSYTQPRIWLHAPREGGWNKVSLAHTISHEMGHNRGLRHKDMKGNRRYSYVAGWEQWFAWANDLPLERKPARAGAQPVDHQALRYDRVLASISRWEAKLARAQRALRKLAVRRRYYEAKVAASKVQQ